MIILYLLAVVIANLSVFYLGPVSMPFNAFLFIGFDLTARDALHDRWHHQNLWRNTALLILSGSLLSYLINREAGSIAVASFVSFAVSGAVDSFVYHALKKSSKTLRINVSNTASAFIDSLLFPTLAFGTIMPTIMILQFVCKVTGGYLWSKILVNGVNNRVEGGQ